VPVLIRLTTVKHVIAQGCMHQMQWVIIYTRTSAQHPIAYVTQVLVMHVAHA